MQNNGIIFSSYEQQVMTDKAFLLAKRDITEKVEILLSKLEKSIDKSFFNPLKLEKKLDIKFQGPKISKGENFHSLPYMVLDHPRYFSQEGVFSFRSMFWWGNFWSFTVHVQGDIFEKVKGMLEPGPLNFGIPVYLGIGENTWEYDYSEENFRLFPESAGQEIYTAVMEQPFLKLGSKINLDKSPDEILASGFDIYQQLMSAFIQE